jgi:hypothetical protein
VAERPSRTAERLGYEPKDVSVRLVLLTVFTGLLVVALAGAALYGLQKLYATLDPVSPEPPLSPLERSAPEPPPPQLQAEPGADFATYLARERAILESYAWQDEEAGIARIPIGRAMQLLAERGWPQPAAGPRLPPRPATGRGEAGR